MDTTGYVKKQTLYLAMLGALIVGFVGGVAYSVYFTPAASTAQLSQQQQQQQMAELITQLEQASKDHPEEVATWVQLGHAYFDSGQAGKAIAAYNKALELQPGDLNVMTDLGVMYHQNKQHKKAIELFDQVLALDPKHEQSRFNKGVVLLTGLNDRKAALTEWKTLVKYHPMAAAPSGKMVGDLIDQLEASQDKQ
ncbi:tetratricopeptide repeat protein [Desulfobulbus rhabdoformis]|uniref:tetratricopeptide repeat protein n=1 Tax=Desulfobulbus rhabdoformis TaxID=34032 RepID=UPI0019629D8F|nr:tetratricopeptide repeat protein [Desulfobulbus rhabdoformis]MBM9615834.1 tetratricopeptide repeat protein [Desulfobulbus rhabdoformis]